MAFCTQCGQEINSAFCPHCGADQRPAEPENKVTGGVRGRSIASIVLGAESLCMSGFTALYLFLQGLFSLMVLEAEIPFGAFFYIYVFLYGLITLGSSIAGKILGEKALKLLEGYRPAKIGVTLNKIALILNIIALALGLLIAIGSVAAM